MKRLFYLMSFILCIGFLCACAQTEETGIVNSWECMITSAEQTEDNLHGVGYIDEIIVSSTGCLSFENESDFDIVIFLFVDDIAERAEPLKANSKVVLYEIKKDVEYAIGVFSDYEVRKIKLLVHDGEMDLVESEPKKPVSKEKAIKMAKKYVKTDREYYANFDNPSIVEKVGDKNLRVKDITTHERISSDKFVGRELYVIEFYNKNPNASSCLVYVDKNKGVVLGMGSM